MCLPLNYIIMSSLSNIFLLIFLSVTISYFGQQYSLGLIGLLLISCLIIRLPTIMGFIMFLYLLYFVVFKQLFDDNINQIITEKLDILTNIIFKQILDTNQYKDFLQISFVQSYNQYIKAQHPQT
jgi:hypothetical protein